MSVLDGLVSELNTVIDNREVATTVTTAAVLGAFGGLYRLIDRFLIHRKRITVTTDFDQAVNIDEKNLDIQLTDGSPVNSIAIVRIANTGTEGAELASDPNDRFQIGFAGRTVRTIKVRDPEEYEEGTRRRAAEKGQAREDLVALRRKITATTVGVHEDPEHIVLPGDVYLRRGQVFQIAVFLAGDPNPGEEKVLVRGRLSTGRLITRGRTWWWRRAAGVALVLAILISFSVGVLTAHRALTPRATCVGALQLNIEGSTAFAHVVSEAVADYSRLCPAAQIAITADGSDQAIKNHAHGLPDDTIAMVDDAGQQVPAGWHSHAVGVVIFGVIANVNYPNAVSGPGDTMRAGGYLSSDLRALYKVDTSSQDPPYVAVGRPGNSGSASAFDSWLHLDPSILEQAAACPNISSGTTTPDPAIPTKGVCDVGTTQKMLSFVNDNPNAIGFAEIDAIPQFPYLTVLPIDGALPTRANVLSGRYTFAYPEVLYTAAAPQPQVSAFLSFIQSPAESEQLSQLDAGFIPCADLGGSSQGGDCG